MDNFEYIKGYENLYKINRNGEIYSCWYKKIMKHLKTDDGYYYINLKKEGIRKKGYIHRLLALQYIENPDNKPEVDHIDRNKNNHSLENLRWVTKLENMQNRDDVIANFTEEQKLTRLEKIRKYKAEWARAKRLKLKEPINKII
jgi:hypothetical protein